LEEGQTYYHQIKGNPKNKPLMPSPTHSPPIPFTFLMKQTIAVTNITTHKAVATNQTKAHINESPLIMPLTITKLTMANGIAVASKLNQNAYPGRFLRGNLFSRLPPITDSLVLATGKVYIVHKQYHRKSGQVKGGKASRHLLYYPDLIHIH